MNGGASLVGSLLGGRYRLLRVIGRGGMGTVYEAEQVDLGRRVALKVLGDGDARAFARFRQEASAAGALRSPHVVSVLDFQAPPGEPPFLVMELLEGESLAAVLAREGRIEPSRAVRIAAQMLAALDVAHRAGLVHRDVKPSNVFLSRTLAGEIAKLLDFGIVKDQSAAVVHTTLGAIVGTPGYLAPEQVRGAPIDARVDVHAVGVVLFEMLTGTRPWNPASLFADILERVPPLASDLVPGVPRVVAEIVARSLAKDADARFRTAAEMLAALAPFVQGAPSGPVPVAISGAHHDAALAPTVPSGAGAHTAPGTAGAGLFVAIVAAVLVFGGGAAAAWWAYARPDGEASARTTPDAGAASATATPAAAAARPDADAGANGQAKPTPAARPTATAKPTSPVPAPAASGKTSARCSCRADVSGVGKIYQDVCPRPSVALCTCHVPGHNEQVCATPFDAKNRCGPNNETVPGFSGPGKKPGDPCTGYLDTGTPPGVLGHGTLDCDMCYGDDRFAAAVPGTSCRGTAKSGQVLAGTWACD